MDVEDALGVIVDVDTLGVIFPVVIAPLDGNALDVGLGIAVPNANGLACHRLDTAYHTQPRSNIRQTKKYRWNRNKYRGIQLVIIAFQLYINKKKKVD
jgi:hypothetical protein